MPASSYYTATEVTYAPTIERLPADGYDTINRPGVLMNGVAEAGGLPGNQPVLEHRAMWALYNGIGSGKKITVASVYMTPLQGRTTTAAQLWGVQRLSAMSGGEDISDAVEPLDTNNAAIPAQVLFRDGCSATLTGAALRRLTDLPLLNATRATMLPCWRDPALNSEVLATQKGLTDVQGQVLREGQGLGILTTGGVSRENSVLAVQVFFNIGAASYMLRRLVQTGVWDALIGIFNGAGSGVVIDVRSVSVTEVATDEVATLRRYELGTISGMHPNSTGFPLAITPMDSASGALPSQIVSALRPAVIQIGKDSGLAVPRPNNAALRRMVSAVLGKSAGLAALLDSPRMMGEVFSSDATPGNGFVLREGQGIALFQKDDFSSWGSGYWVTCSMLVDDAPAAGYSRAEVY